MITLKKERDTKKHERRLVFFSSSLITFKKVTTPLELPPANEHKKLKGDI